MLKPILVSMCAEYPSSVTTTVSVCWVSPSRAQSCASMRAHFVHSSHILPFPLLDSQVKVCPFGACLRMPTSSSWSGRLQIDCLLMCRSLVVFSLHRFFSKAQRRTQLRSHPLRIWLRATCPSCPTIVILAKIASLRQLRRNWRCGKISKLTANARCTDYKRKPERKWVKRRGKWLGCRWKSTKIKIKLFSGQMEEEEVKDGAFNGGIWTPDWHSRSITTRSRKTYP